LKIVQYLIEACYVDKEAKDNNGWTALHNASANGQLKIIQYLLKTGHVDTEAKSNDGLTALHNASQYGHLDIVEYFIETRHVNKEAKDNNGWTALHYASSTGRLNIVQYLIETCYVDKEAKDSDGQTAFDLAGENNNSSVVQYLETARADSTTLEVDNTQVGKTSSTTNDNTAVVDQVCNVMSCILFIFPPKNMIIISYIFVFFLCIRQCDSSTEFFNIKKNNTVASVQLEGRLLSSTANSDSIGSSDILIPNLDLNKASSQADKLNQLGSSDQAIDERRDILDLVFDILDLVFGKKCSTTTNTTTNSNIEMEMPIDTTLAVESNHPSVASTLLNTSSKSTATRISSSWWY
jgi:Ankyrin repeats (3 copies)/Ankyrin repeats (many copies)